MNFGLLSLPLWSYAAVALVLSHITIVSVTIFLHRHQSHHALTLHPVASHFFRFWLWLTTGMSTRVWVAIHRKHHTCSDREEDPHSPQIHGLRRVLLEGAELYRIEARNTDTLRRFGHSTPDDWLERHVYAGHPRLGIGLMLILDVVLFGPIGLTVWAVQMLWIPFFAAGVINGVGHFVGYRNFATSDASRNILPWGVLIGGEELHNNHHAYVRSARFSNRWWEFDIGWLYIRILQGLGLAKVRCVAPAVVTKAASVTCDEHTLSAIITHRYAVLMQYARTMGPLTLAEIQRLRPAQPASMQAFSLLDPDRSSAQRNRANGVPSAQGDTAALLHSSDALRTVTDMRQQLSALWTRSAATTAQLVQDLNAWCARAEASGIESLRAFAKRLRTYTQ